MDAKFTIAPPPRAASAGIAACDIKKVVLTLIANSRSSISTGICAAGPTCNRPPATLITTSSPPNSFCARATAARAASGLVRSPVNPRALAPCAVNSLARSATSGTRSTSTSCAPALPSAPATAWPIWPTRPTPVTSATFPLKSGIAPRGDDVVHRRHAALREDDRAVLGDDVHGALDALVVVLQGVKCARRHAVGIRQQRKGKLELGGVPAIRAAGCCRPAVRGCPRARCGGANRSRR